LARGGTLCCLLSDLSYLSTHQDGSCLFIARGATLCCLLAEYLNYQQITNQDGSCLFIARGGDLFSFSFKGSKGVSCLSEEATPIDDYVLSLLSACDTPILPERFKNISKKEGPPSRSVRFVSYSGYINMKKKIKIALYILSTT
jgi:hypothetical protein